MKTYKVQDFDSKESGMKYSNTKALTNRLLLALGLAAVGVSGVSGIAEAANCATCHAPTGQGTTVTDIRPYEIAPFRNITSGSIKGSHAKHMPAATTAATACSPCHGTATATYTTKHRTGFINVTTNTTTSLKYSLGSKIAQSGNMATKQFGTCSAASCHDNGKGVLVASPTWGNTAPVCTACHAAIPADNSHTKHITTSTFSNKATCADCHNGYTPTTSATANHRDNNIDVYKTSVNDLGYGADKTKGSAVSSCTTAYCHSNGQSADGTTTTPVYKPVAWGAASLTCEGCHGASSTTLTSGTHAKHLASNSNNCTSCHTGAGATYTAASHINNSIDVASGLSYANQGTAGNGYSTCSNSATGCHGTMTTKTWGTNTAFATCTKCHGTGTTTVDNLTNLEVVAPVGGTLTGNGLVSNDLQVGAHMTHLKFLNGFSNYSTVQYRCESCHGTLPGAATHASGSATPQGSFKNLATKWSATVTPTYDSATGCSNTYCHNPNAFDAKLDKGTATVPTWTQAAYIADTGNSVANCQQCHLVPGSVGFSKSSAHTGAAAITDATPNQCTSCHGHNGDNSGTEAGWRHLDGIFNAKASSCNGCHAYQASEWVSTASTTQAGTIGAHAAHITYLTTKRANITLTTASDQYASSAASWTGVCGICHGNSTSNHGSGGNGTINVVMDQTYFFGSTGSATYNGTPGGAVANKTCSNLSCHYFTSPQWSN
jgi:predicted CxxxxCH...CXXCH cytochrome family protein